MLASGKNIAGAHRFCELLQRLLGNEYARGVAMGRDAEQRAQVTSLYSVYSVYSVHSVH